MFFLKLLTSFLLSIAISHTNTVHFKNKIGHPNRYLDKIIIPKINLNESFIIGNKAMNKLNYIQLAPYTNLPSDDDAYLIFMAHSGNSKISYFKNIDKLEFGSKIIVNYKANTYTYLVYNKIIISPKNTEALYYKPRTLVLLTCYQHKYRLLVYAKLKPVNN